MKNTMMMAAILLLSGCQNGLKNMTAGQTGCMPNDVKILVKPSAGWDMAPQRFYLAECNGKKYACSYSVQNNSFQNTSCKEVVENK